MSNQTTCSAEVGASGEGLSNSHSARFATPDLLRGASLDNEMSESLCRRTATEPAINRKSMVLAKLGSSARKASIRSLRLARRLKAARASSPFPWTPATLSAVLTCESDGLAHSFCVSDGFMESRHPINGVAQKMG